MLISAARPGGAKSKFIALHKKVKSHIATQHHSMSHLTDSQVGSPSLSGPILLCWEPLFWRFSGTFSGRLADLVRTGRLKNAAFCSIAGGPEAQEWGPRRAGHAGAPGNGNGGVACHQRATKPGAGFAEVRPFSLSLWPSSPYRATMPPHGGGITPTASHRALPPRPS